MPQAAYTVRQDLKCRGQPITNGPSVALEASAEPLLAVVLGDKWRGTPPPDDKIFIAGNGMTGKKLLDRGKKLKLEVFDNIDV